MVCGIIVACDDFNEIVEWSVDNLTFLRCFLPLHHGIPHVLAAHPAESV